MSSIAKDFSLMENMTDNDVDYSEDSSSGGVITQPFSPSDIRIYTPPMNLGDLIDMIQEGWIDFEADYQRADNLWDDGKQSRLIESALLGLRFPAFYFEEVTKRKWRIIDGLQRCSAIRNFCVDQTLALSGLEFLKLDGEHYGNLNFELRRDIRMLPVTVNLLLQGVPNNVKYILFKRLNTGGLDLNPQEIRNAMFQGPAIDLVKEMANAPEFLKATGYKIPTRRKQAQDFISRFIAFYLTGYKNYSPDIERFINSVMEKINAGGYSDLQLRAMYTNFTESMTLAYEVFGSYAFRKLAKEGKRGPINKALFETVAVTFARLTPRQRKTIVDNNSNKLLETVIQIMLIDDRFSNSLSTATGRPENVNTRFGTFERIIADHLSNITND